MRYLTVIIIHMNFFVSSIQKVICIQVILPQDNHLTVKVKIAFSKFPNDSPTNQSQITGDA